MVSIIHPQRGQSNLLRRISATFLGFKKNKYLQHASSTAIRNGRLCSSKCLAAKTAMSTTSPSPSSFHKLANAVSESRVNARHNTIKTYPGMPMFD